MKTTGKLIVWAVATPGADMSAVYECDTMEEARRFAKRYDSRRDLRYQDVEIRLPSGKRIEFAGPCR